jgi:glycosyltransferase involved in cell wall biosynthesis
MKIIFLNQHYWPYEGGGIEKSIRDLAHELKKKNNTIYIICSIPCHSRIWRDQKLIVINLFEFYTNKIWAFFKLFSILKRINPKFINTNCIGIFSYYSWIAARFAFVKIFHTVRFNELDYYSGYQIKQFCAKKIFKKFSFFLIKNLVFKYLTISNFAKDLLKKRYNIDAELIYNGFKFKNKIFKKKTKKVLTIGFLGRIEKDKGILDFINFSNRISSRQKFKFLIIGRGGDKKIQSKIKSWIGINKKFKDWVKNPNFFYNNIDILITPFLWDEYFGRVFVEAYMNGVQVCGYKSGASVEINNLLKSKAIFVNKYDIQSLVNGAISYSRNKNKKEIKNIILPKQLDISYTAKKYHKLFSKCI